MSGGRRQRGPVPAPPRRADPGPGAVRAAFRLLLAACAAALAASAWLRPIDGDEGYYAAAAGEVAAGRLPYRDFFYPQGPLLPPVYAAVVTAAGHSLRALRWLSAACTLGAVLLWWRWLAGRRRLPAGAAWTTLALLALNPHLVSWGVTVKTYALTGLLATAALLALWRGLSGALRPAAWLVLGWAVGLLPVLAAWAWGPDRFLFDVLGYHELRFSELRALHPDAGPLTRLAGSLAGTAEALGRSPWLVLVLALAAAGSWRGGRRDEPADPDHPDAAEGAAVRRLARIAALAAATMFAVRMLPDPVHAQYFTAALPPLLVPPVAVGVARLVGGRPVVAWPVGAAAVVAAALVMAVQRPGMAPGTEWTWASYEQVVARVERLSDPEDVVFSFWPGYVFETGRRHLPGMENHFAIGVSESLTPAAKARYAVADRHRLELAFRARKPRLVISGTWMNEVHTALDDAQMLQLVRTFRERYGLASQVGGVRIYSREAPVDPDLR